MSQITVNNVAENQRQSSRCCLMILVLPGASAIGQSGDPNSFDVRECSQHNPSYRNQGVEVKHELRTPTQWEGYVAYMSGDPVDACPYDEATDFARWFEWKQGYCTAHAQEADAVEAMTRLRR